MRLSSLAWLTLILLGISSAGAVRAQEFTGGGASIYFGTGAPNSVDASSALARDLNLDDDTGNYLAGVMGFYQAERYRIGGALQAHVWGGAGFDDRGAGDGAAGVVTAIMGVYGTYTFRHDRTLFNVGGIVGAGRSVLGYSMNGGASEVEENVATFYIEPLVSFGVSATRWFGVEFQFSVPIFILTDDLALQSDGTTYEVDTGDMTGVSFVAKLTFGRIASY